MPEPLIDNRCTLRIIRTIASGGMGTVCEAVQSGAGGFEKRVAVKDILPEYSRDPSFVEMFVAEAKLVANLVHENIVQIYQLNEHDSRHYIVMEFVHGLSLADFIELHRDRKPARSGTSIPVELAVFIVSRIARGLAYAHNRRDAAGQPLRIVHRDVCPRNILITTEGLPKLGDFGIASAVNMNLGKGTASGNGPGMGKLNYMAPEQAQHGAVDFRADIYSLGLVLFELLTLRKMREPWQENLMAAAVNGWVDWTLLPRRLPRKLLSILKRMMEPDPDRRFGTTDDLALELELFIYSKGYGPTVMTLEQYLRQVAPPLYQANRQADETGRPVAGDQCGKGAREPTQMFPAVARTRAPAERDDHNP